MTRPAPLTEPAIVEHLAAVPAWTQDGTRIRREFVCVDFAHAIAFVVKIGAIADELDHHPDLDVRWRTVLVSCTTHDAGGLSALDFTLAQRLDAAFTEH